MFAELGSHQEQLSLKASVIVLHSQHVPRGLELQDTLYVRFKLQNLSLLSALWLDCIISSVFN